MMEQWWTKTIIRGWGDDEEVQKQFKKEWARAGLGLACLAALSTAFDVDLLHFRLLRDSDLLGGGKGRGLTRLSCANSLSLDLYVDIKEEVVSEGKREREGTKTWVFFWNGVLCDFFLSSSPHHIPLVLFLINHAPAWGPWEPSASWAWQRERQREPVVVEVVVVERVFCERVVVIIFFSGRVCFFSLFFSSSSFLFPYLARFVGGLSNSLASLVNRLRLKFRRLL